MIHSFEKQNTLFIYDYFIGFLIGIGCLIPGMSGGSVAIILGVYERILKNAATIFKSLRKSIIDTLPIILGTITAILSLSSILYEFKRNNETLANLTFCIITVICTIVFIKTNIRKDQVKYRYILAGGSVSALLSILTRNYSINAIKSLIYVFIIGLVLSIALILPGISFSYMMLFLGIYESTLDAIANLKIGYICFLSFGLLAGTLIFSKLMLNLIDKHKNEVYSVILGFIFVSLAEILANSLNY